MTELLKTYFERDLSPGEMDELGALLESSPEAALEWRENARAFYLSLGLPEPEPPAKWRGWLMGGGAGIALFLGLANWQGSGAGPSERPSLAAESGAFMVAEPPTDPGSRPPAQAQPGPAKTGDYLAVEIKRGRPGQVMVRILDDSGAEIRRLFDGRLESGDWNFKWDGMRGGGLRAAAGRYVIEVHEDGRIRNKRVRLGVAN